MKLTIFHDSDCESPREYDNVGVMVCWHRRHNLGDAHNFDVETFHEELAKQLDDTLDERLYRVKGELYDVLYHCVTEDGGLAWSEGCQYAHRATEPIAREMVERALDGCIILPLYLYDHSGLVMSTGAFSCPWDSGQVGYIYCLPETIRREFNGDKELARKCLESEVDIYSTWLSGECYGYEVDDDSCWGFIGEDHLRSALNDLGIPDKNVDEAFDNVQY